MARKKKLPLLEDVEITDVAAEGKSIARIGNEVLFVAGMVPGDVADIQVIRKKRKYMEGIAVGLKKASPFRQVPFCSHFGICGGCKWQVLPYDMQLRFKEKQVWDNLQRIGKVELPEFSRIIGSKYERYYRNKLEFTFSANRWLSEEEIRSGIEFADRRALGFHLPGKFDRVLNIDQCYLQHELSNEILSAVRNFTLDNHYGYYHQHNASGLMRNLIIRNSSHGEWMVVIVFHSSEMEKIEGLMDFLKEKFPFITSLQYVINPKVNDTIHDLEIRLFSGRDHIFEELDGMKFKIGPKSFFQTNTLQTQELYRAALALAGLKGHETVYDLYTGTGTIAIYTASHCSKVIGIESVAAAIEDAKENAACNGIKNAFFFEGDIRKVLQPQFIVENGKPDVMITDPPRAGMHGDVVETILTTAPEKIVYISCNPATQARDIQILGSKYKVTAVQPVDMFPQTHHVENIVRLELQ